MEEDGVSGSQGLGVSGGVWLERGRRKKKLVGPSFCKVILIDALLGGCIEEWIGVGLRVGMGEFFISNPSTAKAIYTLDGHRRGGIATSRGAKHCSK